MRPWRLFRHDIVHLSKQLCEHRYAPFVDAYIGLYYFVSGQERSLARLTENEIVDRVLTALAHLGCPAVRRAEGTEEWRQKQVSYKYTPDLVAGPIVGGGDPKDFLIDVYAPTGKYFTDAGAGLPEVASRINPIHRDGGSFRLAEVGSAEDMFLANLNKKIAKYSGERENSIMVGLATYHNLEVAGGESLGRILVAHDIVGVFAAQFGFPADRMDEFWAAMMPVVGLVSPIICLASWEARVAFAVAILDHERDGTLESRNVLLCVNAGVVHDEFAWRDHPVVKWLRRFRRREPGSFPHLGDAIPSAPLVV